MPSEVKNTFSYEASMATLAVQLTSAKELFDAKIEGLKTQCDERDRRYEDRFVAMDEKTSLALAGSKEAVTKAEVATEKRFDSVNEFRGSLKDQAATLMPRPEAESKFGAFEDKLTDVKKVFDRRFEEMTKEIQNLRESRSVGSGEKLANKNSQAIGRWTIGLSVTVFFSFISLVITIITLVTRK